MKTLYITNSPTSAVVFDTETNTFNGMRSEREAISRIYTVKEDMQLVYKQKDEYKTADVKKDDLVIVFYDDSFKNNVIVVNSKEWLENIVDYNEREQKAKEEWAKKHSEDACEPCEGPADAC